MRDFIADFAEKCKAEAEIDEPKEEKDSDLIVTKFLEENPLEDVVFDNKSVFGNDYSQIPKSVTIDLSPPERRYRSFVVSDRAIVNLFSSSFMVDKYYVYRHKIVDVPRDYKIESVSYSPEYGGFLFVISHPSFDVVPDGERPPFFLVQCEFVKLAREPERKD